MRTQLSLCEQETPAEGKGEQPLFSPNQKEQLETHTREPSLVMLFASCNVVLYCLSNSVMFIQ